MKGTYPALLTCLVVREQVAVPVNATKELNRGVIFERPQCLLER